MKPAQAVVPITPQEDAATKGAANAKAAEQAAHFGQQGKYQPSAPLGKGEKPEDRDLDTHCYEGVLGWGYTVIRRMTKGGQRYIKIENHGPELWREQDWRPDSIEVPH